MEKKNDKKLTFGRYLSQVRIEKGISLSEIAKKIKVNTQTLHLIENSDHEKLPDPVFTKGFIRAYADVIGADKKATLSLYHESYEIYQNALRAEAELVGYGKKFWLHLGGAFGLLAVVMVASFFLLTDAELWEGKELAVKTLEQPPEDPPESSLPQEEKAALSEKAKDSPPMDGIVTDSSEKKDAAQMETVQEQDKTMLLKITAVEDTRIKIIIDDASPEELLIKKGEVNAIKARTRYNILIGNATGVKLELNGAPVDIPGKSGQVATLMLP